ncbi:uncharacterized protein LOC136006750 [Lathamus discolor]|uniref:uncharacterized protein LOC136006750 n=1 Tax=Lathamus discolor TaxID=678569 RepID=UPI0032B78DD6
MERQGLGLEERTDWLLQRSTALLQRGPAHRAGPAPSVGPAPSADPAPDGDPLAQWRLRRRVEAAEEPSRARPCWTSHDPRGAAGLLGWMPSSRSCDAKEAWRPMKVSSQGALRQPWWRSGDPSSATQPIGRGSQALPWGHPCWTSRDPCEASMPTECSSRDVSQPTGEASHEPLLQEPPARSRGPREAPQPIRSSSQEPLWRHPCWTSPDSIEPSRPKEGISHEPLQQVPCLRSHDPHETPQPIRSCSQDALRQGLPLEDHSAMQEEPSLRSCDPQDTPQPISGSSQDASRSLKDDIHGAPVDPILRLLRRRRRLLWQSLRAVDSALAMLPHQKPLMGSPDGLCRTTTPTMHCAPPP